MSMVSSCYIDRFMCLSHNFTSYLVYQGGDWGHMVSRGGSTINRSIMLTVFIKLGGFTVFHHGHKHVKAWQTNMPLYVLIPLFCAFKSI